MSNDDCRLSTVRPGLHHSTFDIRHWTLGLLAALALLAMWEAFLITNRPQTRGCGGNFTQYYTAGAIVREGGVRRLYDQTYFQRLQEALRDDPLPSIYPPTVGMVIAPLTRLPYANALVVWWAIQALCILATGVLFYRTMELPQPWRINALMALAALLPLWIAVGIGQLTPIFVLALAGGLALHKRGKRAWAGLLLSVLALKPQLAAGLVLWMLLRRDYRTLLGLAAGFALQAAAVAVALGPGAWLDYFHALPAISAMTRRTHFSPLVEASFVGIASNLASAAARAAWETAAMKLAYALTVSFALVMLCRVVWSRRPLGMQGRLSLPERQDNGDNCEYACGVLFMTIVPPYLIVYDQSLIAVARSHALVVAALALGCRFVRHNDRGRGEPLAGAGLQFHRAGGAGGNVCPFMSAVARGSECWTGRTFAVTITGSGGSRFRFVRRYA